MSTQVEPAGRSGSEIAARVPDALPAPPVREPAPARIGRWREWVGSLAGRITLIVLLGVLVAQSIPLAFYIYDHTIGRNALVADSIAQRVISVVGFYEAAPAPARRDVLRAVSTPFFSVTIRPNPPPVPPPAQDGLIAELSSRLAPLGDRRVGIWLIQTSFGPGTLVSVPLTPGGPPGQYMVFEVRPEPTDTTAPWRQGFFLAFTALVFVGALWAALRTAAPLSRFAEAADRFGTDVYAPPLPEGGSGEVRRATRAFNRMQERLRRFVDDRTMMMAAISHDLRTTLTRLRLRTEFIDDDEQRGKAENDLNEMLAMLEATLAFARDEAVAEARKSVDLAALLQSLCDDYADAGKRVMYAGPDRQPIQGRPVALRRAFSNLIENAIRYGGEATVRLTMADATIVVLVEDRGPGIPADQREQVFAPFFRLETSRSRETGGMGLGLSVARSVVRGHGGDIGLEDREGGGLRVRVTLPLGR